MADGLYIVKYRCLHDPTICGEFPPCEVETADRMLARLTRQFADFEYWKEPTKKHRNRLLKVLSAGSCSL